MKPSELTITLDLPPKALHPNARATWRERHRYRKAYRLVAGDAAGLQCLKLGGRPKLPAATIQLDFYLRTKHRHDPDNLIAWAKTAIDALTDARILLGDRNVTYLPPRQFTDKKNPRMVITVTGSNARIEWKPK